MIKKINISIYASKSIFRAILSIMDSNNSLIYANKFLFYKFLLGSPMTDVGLKDYHILRSLIKHPSIRQITKIKIICKIYAIILILFRIIRVLHPLFLST